MIQADCGHMGRLGDALCAIPYLRYLSTVHDGVAVVDDTFQEPARALIPDNLGITFRKDRDPHIHTLDLDLHACFWEANKHDGRYRGMHMAQCYFAQAGAHDHYPDLPLDLNLLDYGKMREGNTVVVSPFSATDGDGTAKMWTTDKWLQLCAAVLPMKGVHRITVIGSGAEDYSAFHVPHVTIAAGWPLRDVMSLLRSCRLLVSIDNGISHMAHFGAVPRHVLLYPDCLNPAWVANPRAVTVREGPPYLVSVGTMVEAVKTALA